MIRSYTLLLCSFLFFIACENTPPQTEAQLEETEISPPGLVQVEAPDSLSEYPQTLSPDLLGTWRLVNMEAGEISMSSADFGKSSPTITEEGTLILSTPDLPDQELPFQFIDGSIFTEQEGEQHIRRLTQDSLILSQQIDGEEILRIYLRSDS
ncbi:MAG: hypothetical protein AAGC85_09035 [Bacteroidota bacterium]